MLPMIIYNSNQEDFIVSMLNLVMVAHFLQKTVSFREQNVDYVKT